MMTKLCMICGEPMRDGDEVIVGVRAKFVAIPSTVTWGVQMDPTPQYVFVNHAACEEG